MQISTRTIAASQPSPWDPDDDGMLLKEPIRAGGPGAKPAPDVVGQAKVTLPMNFGLQGWIDVSAGTRLGTFGSLADAQAGVFELARGRTAVGILREAAGFTVAELLVPDFTTQPWDTEWAHVRPTPLVLGPDPARDRSIESVRVLADRGARPELLDLYTRGGSDRVALG